MGGVLEVLGTMIQPLPNTEETSESGFSRFKSMTKVAGFSRQ